MVFVWFSYGYNIAEIPTWARLPDGILQFLMGACTKTTHMSCEKANIPGCGDSKNRETADP